MRTGYKPGIGRGHGSQLRTLTLEHPTFEYDFKRIKSRIYSCGVLLPWFGETKLDYSFLHLTVPFVDGLFHRRRASCFVLRK